MAQTFSFENNTQTTVNFSEVQNGNGFVYGEEAYWKLDNNNPNAVKFSDSSVHKMNNDDQVIIPNNALLKYE